MASVDLDCLPLGRQSPDLNHSPPTEVPVSAESQPAPELNGAQVAIQGASNGLDTTSGYQQRGRGQSEDLPSLGELLHGAGSALGPASAGSKEMCLRERSARDGSHIAKNDCDEALYPESRRGTSRDAGRYAGSSQVYGHDGATLEEYEGTQSGERSGEEGVRSTPPASGSNVGCSTLGEKNAPPTLRNHPLNTDDLFPPMSDNDGGPSSGDGLTIPSPDPLARKNEDAVQEDNEAEEEANTQPILASNRGRSGDPASRRAETRCNSNVMPRTDHYDADTDDDDDIRPLLKKHRIRVAALLRGQTQAPKFRYPPGWEIPIASDRGEVAGSQGKPLVIQYEEPDIPSEKTPPQIGAENVSLPKRKVVDSAFLYGTRTRLDETGILSTIRLSFQPSCVAIYGVSSSRGK